MPSKRRLNADQSRRRKLLVTETFYTQVPESSEDEESSDYLTPVAKEIAAEPTNRTFNLDFEPDSPQLTQTLRSLQKKQMLEEAQRSSPIETISRRVLFNEDSNSFVGFPSESQEFQTLPISFEVGPKAGAALIPSNSASVLDGSSESGITLSSETNDASVDKSSPKTIPKVSSRKSMRSKVLRRTKYTPISMDFSGCKSRSVGGRIGSVGMVLATPAKPSGKNIADHEDAVGESNLTLDNSSIFIAETQVLPITTKNKLRRSVNTRKSAMVLETPVRRSKAYVPPVLETPTTVMDITNCVENAAQSHVDLTLDQSSIFTVQTQILAEIACNKPITPSQNIQEAAVVPLLIPTSCSVVVTRDPVSDAVSKKRRRTLFTPNKLIELNRSSLIETRDQLLGDSPRTSESTKGK